ncbi:MAG: DUF1015 domain-containing protein [Tissierellia bacterium]|nr:DUF1015 domain-containing protein [Tissierellia bacterium]
MVKIKDFKAFRPDYDMADKIAELPYDVMSTEEAKEILKKNNLSIIQIDRPESNYDNMPFNDPKVYEKAKRIFDEFIDEDLLKQDQENSLYLYEQTFMGNTQRGIVCLSSSKDYLDKKIKVHEKTIALKEKDRTDHIDITGFHLGPIFLLFEENKKIEMIIQDTVNSGEVLFDFVKNGVRNKAYRIINSDELIEEFENIEYTFIADGHHRCKSAINVYLKDIEEGIDRESDYFLSVLFPTDDIFIMPYNRYLSNLKGNSSRDLIEKLKKFFTIEENDEFKEPEEKGEIFLYTDGKSYRLKFKDEYKNDDALEGLDVYLLQKYVFEEIFGIKDPTKDEDLNFIGGIRGIDYLKNLVDENGGASFSLFPTAAEDLISVAKSGRMMPAKSTWFEPKLLNGLFVHKM